MAKVLLAVDGSELALRAARRFVQLGRTFRALEVALITVQPDPRGYGEIALHLTKERAEAMTRTAGDRALEAAGALLAQQSIPFTREVRIGETAQTIVAAANELECWMIVMGSHGMGALANVVVGSTTTKVVHLARTPVLIVPPRPENVDALGPVSGKAVKVLVAVDGSEGALRAVDELIARLWWFEQPPEIHLVTVEHRLPIDVAIAGMVKAEVIRAHQDAQAEAALKEARARFRAQQITPVEHTKVGEPASGIHATAQALHCDLIVVGTRGLGTVGGLVFGSTATKLLHLAEVPVLCVR